MSARERPGPEEERGERLDRPEPRPRPRLPATPRERLRASLSSRAALRSAFLLQEVLGPPVGLRGRREGGG